MALFWLIAAASGAEPPAVLDPGALRAVCERAVGEWRIAPGLAIGWAGPEGRGVVTCGASGSAASAEVTGSTLFEVGSLTKVFTASLLADMVDRGEVRLDEPLGAFAPGGPTSFASPAIAAATLEQLATHTSGLPRLAPTVGMLGGAILFRGNPYRDLGPDAVWDDAYGVTDRFRVQGYVYSNLGVAALGQALAVRAGMPFADLLAQRVLAPLGMTRTRVTTGAADPAGGTEHAATGHTVNGLPAPPWTLDGFAPAGGLCAPAAEMLTFLVANLDESAPGSATAHRAGLGWRVADRRGHRVLWHSGGTGGFSSFLALDVERKLGVFVLANSTASVDRLAGWLIDTVDAPRPPAASGLACSGMAALGLHAGLTLLPPRWGVARWLRPRGRGDAFMTLWSVAFILAMSATLADLRAFPTAFLLGGGGLLLAVHTWGLWSVRAEADPPRPWPVRAWKGVFLALLGWVAFIAPWWG